MSDLTVSTAVDAFMQSANSTEMRSAIGTDAPTDERPPAAHSQEAATISDATAVGLALMTAVDAAGARSEIYAETAGAAASAQAAAIATASADATAKANAAQAAAIAASDPVGSAAAAQAAAIAASDPVGSAAAAQAAAIATASADATSKANAAQAAAIAASDPVGSAAAAQANAIAASCQRASNLSDLANTSTALDNLGASALGKTLLAIANRLALASAVGALGASAVETRNADFTVDSAKPGAVYNVTAGASGVAVTLPAAATAGDGFTIRIRKDDSSAGDVKIASDTYRLTNQDASICLRSNGSTWVVHDRYDPNMVGWQSGVFGSYGDGDVTLSSGTTTLSRDMHYRRLTITGSNTVLVPGGYAVYGETLDLSAATGTSCIRQNSQAAGNASGTAAGTTSSSSGWRTVAPSGGLATAPAGQVNNGTTPSTLSATSLHLSGANNSSGGKGGDGSSGTGGAARAGVNGSTMTWRNLYAQPGYAFFNGSIGDAGFSGQAGSSGGGDGVNAGGGAAQGARAGFHIWLAFRKIVTAAGNPVDVVRTLGGKGGNGGTPPTGNCGGGGGGGGGHGGFVTLIYCEMIGPGLGVDVTGGNGGDGGAGVGSGTAGDGGHAGASGYVARCNGRTGVWTDFGPEINGTVANTGQTGGVAITTQIVA